MIAYILLGGNPDDLGGVIQPGAVTGPESSALAAECKTGADANERDDCRILGYVNSVQTYWNGEFQASNLKYEPIDTVLFTDATQRRLRDGHGRVRAVLLPDGQARVPRPRVLQGAAHRFGATGGSLAQGYVVAHEYGHHVQDLLGVLGQGTGEQGAEGRSVRTELQADCYAGSWANHAEAGILAPVTDAQIADALDAAAAVGDDRIQESVNGRVDPGGLDARLGRTAPALVHGRLQGRRPDRLRHVQRRDLRRV